MSFKNLKRTDTVLCDWTMQYRKSIFRSILKYELEDAPGRSPVIVHNGHNISNRTISIPVFPSRQNSKIWNQGRLFFYKFFDFKFRLLGAIFYCFESRIVWTAKVSFRLFGASTNTWFPDRHEWVFLERVCSSAELSQIRRTSASSGTIYHL